MEEIIQLEEQFYILTTSSRVDDRTCVLKHGDTFAVFDRYGDIQPLGKGDQGLYHTGTRFLSRVNLSVCGERPVLLGSTLNENNVVLNSDMTNPDVRDPRSILIPRGALHIFRTKFLWQGTAYDRVRIANFSQGPLPVTALIQIESDFADIFEVRGSRRERKGRRLGTAISGSEMQLSYEGLDGVIRRMRLQCHPEPLAIAPGRVEFSATLEPKAEAVFMMTTACEIGETRPSAVAYEVALEKAVEEVERYRELECQLTTSNAQFNAWVNRSIRDLRIMITQTPHGLYPYAGIPWYSTVFGRDGILTALSMLWVNPDIARGVLSYLAQTQAREVQPENDAEPGKILHEAREGELAATGEIPFGRYYGSVDATPLFVVLAAAYYERTADSAFLLELWPAIEQTLTWIHTYGDVDGDGFVEYLRRSSKGLMHQGWKDSVDSVFHADGALAEGPIALCEVQGYVYWAKRKAAELARVLGKDAFAEQWTREAEHLQQQFESAFWCEELGTYALALDGQKRPCRVRTSNAGHCLMTGIAAPAHAKRVAETLLRESSYSGWGIRTLDSEELRYNPMSYHNGSVWPHDNAFIAAGFWRYGLRTHALQVVSGLFDMSRQVELSRLPELICGFRRRLQEGPTLYPVACSPQAWSSGAVMLLAPIFLGMSIDAPQRQIFFNRPCLPPFLQEVVIEHLSIQESSLTVTIRGRGENVDVHVEREKGSIEAVVYK